MKIYIFLLFSFISSLSWGQCKIETYSRFIITPHFDLNDAQKGVKRSNCPKNVISTFVQLLSKGSGTLSSQWLSRETSTAVSLIPNRVRIQTLDQLMTDRLVQKRNWFWKKSEIMGSKSRAIFLNEGDTISFNSCSLCSKTGEQSAKVTIYNSLSNRRIEKWIKGKILIKSKGLISKAHLGVTNGPLSPRLFKLTNVLTERPEELYSNSKGLAFYKLNKPKKSGEPIRFNDLTPIRLVSSGRPVSISYSGNGIKLSGTAIPTQSGKIGETIQLKNTKSKKVIIGRVIDFNKVSIEL